MFDLRLLPLASLAALLVPLLPVGSSLANPTACVGVTCSAEYTYITNLVTSNVTVIESGNRPSQANSGASNSSAPKDYLYSANFLTGDGTLVEVSTGNIDNATGPLSSGTAGVDLNNVVGGKAGACLLLEAGFPGAGERLLDHVEALHTAQAVCGGTDPALKFPDLGDFLAAPCGEPAWLSVVTVAATPGGPAGGAILRTTTLEVTSSGAVTVDSTESLSATIDAGILPIGVAVTGWGEAYVSCIADNTVYAVATP